MHSISVVFFVEQKTAYATRISDWSSDVCSSDLRVRDRSPSPTSFEAHPIIAERAQVFAAELMIGGHAVGGLDRLGIGDPSRHRARIIGQDAGAQRPPRADMREIEIGRASCRERVCQFV